MKRFIALMLAAVMFASFAGSVVASEKDLRAKVNKVVGTPYKYGGTTTKGFDCSGFVLHIFNQYNVSLPRTSSAQAQKGTKVNRSDLQPGDLVFFNTSGKGISHAGIYLGNGEFAHSSSSKGVIVSKLSSSYYDKRYVTARRVASAKTFI
ncbi:C40 family peptidase [Paenibacillus sp. 1P07SE]|uniref:C40 family peptidase n=1 Tax=Paenibacillus sp. 1P07SE TaxID=3132209 RepID=UPI0039A5CC82